MVLRDRKFGFTPGFFQLAAIAIAVWYAAASQNNGAAYLLVFALAGFFCVGFLQALRNLSGLKVRVHGVSAGYAPLQPGDVSGAVEVRVCVHNDGLKARYGCAVSLPGYATSPESASSLIPVLLPAAMQEVVVRVTGLPRGCHTLSLVEISSLYPVGQLRVTRCFSIEPLEIWIYPAPFSQGEMPAGDSPATGAGGGGSGGDDFMGVRPFQEGESQRHVDWKAVSRGHPRMVKQFGGGMDRAVLLDWDRLSGDVESRLSALCFWLHEVEREGFQYAMKLPGIETSPGSGPEHLHAALRLLARYPGYSQSRTSRDERRRKRRWL